MANASHSSRRLSYHILILITSTLPVFYKPGHCLQSLIPCTTTSNTHIHSLTHFHLFSKIFPVSSHWNFLIFHWHFLIPSSQPLPKSLLVFQHHCLYNITKTLRRIPVWPRYSGVSTISWPVIMLRWKFPHLYLFTA